MATTLVKTDFQFPGQVSVYHGKVRDVYDINDDLMVMVATDRISAFDVILPKGIPFKGQVLNQIAATFLDATADIVPNWKLATPDPMVTVGLKCEGFRVEMIIRGYLTGSAWRDYKDGCRELCGVKLPEGMKENQKFPEPIITPTTKAEAGHDENISREEIIKQGIVSKEDYETMERYTRALFARGSEMAAKKGLILVDTKYEFGKRDGKVYLIDEIHTPDSSRYFYADGYEERFEKGEAQRQLSKEFVRQWLIENGFMGKAGQTVPEMTDEYCQSVSDRYIELVYDFMNRAMTFGIDKLWRRKAVGFLRRKGVQSLLDVATGTGDFAMLLCRKLHPKRLVGVDLSENMLSIAQQKAQRAGLDDVIEYAKGDCLALDFGDGEFDAVTVAYGVRNFEHLEQGYAEMHRVLRQGGMLCVIELSTPRNPLVLWFYRFYTRRLIPLLGRSISKDARAYSYLPESIAAVPQGNDMLDIMRRAGFNNCTCRTMTFGTCSIYLGEK